MNDISDITKLKLMAALKETAPPCEVFKCWRYQDCKEMFLACKAFAHYVNTGIVEDPMTNKGAHPTRQQYKKIYRYDAI